MKRLSDGEVEIQLKKNPAWQRNGDSIEREWKFGSFLEAVGFVNLVAAEAERLDHHPDILIRYNKVKLQLSTHDANGLSERDFRFASACDQFVRL